MKTYLECYPCVIQQALEAAKFAGLDRTHQHEMLDQAMRLLQNMSPGVSPPVIGQQIHRVVREYAENGDPYASVKHEANREAMALLPQLRREVRESPDPLETAVRYAIAGNIIDFGARSDSMDVGEEIEQVKETEFGRIHLEGFREAVTSADSIVYLGDNAGEIALDRLLIELLLTMTDAEITLVVKGSPVLNDATADDAREVGLDDLVPVVDNGSDAPGTLMTEIDEAVRDLIVSADLIIAKGQGNYETLSQHPYPIFFLLKLKCPVIARDMDLEAGTYVLSGNGGFQ